MTSPPRPAARPAAPPTRAMPVVESMHRTIHGLEPIVPESERRRRPTWFLPAVAALLVLCALAAALAPGPPRTLPDALAGTWRSEAASHAGRVLVLGRDMVAFGGGGVAATPHVITAVRRRVRGDSTIVDIAYDDAGTPATLRVAHEGTAPDALPTALVVGAGAGGSWVRAR